METPELKKQFRACLFDKKIAIATPSNDLEIFEAELNVELGKEIKIGWHDWIETKENALNYYECCGILILFGIRPPEFKDLCSLLGISIHK